MVLEKEIFNRYSKAHALAVVRWIGGDKHRFAELMKYFFSSDRITALNSSWLVTLCAEHHPSVVAPWLSKMVQHAAKNNAFGSVKRNVVRTMQFVPVPRSLQGRVSNLCFSFLQDPKEAIAVKAFSMTVLANIASQEPDLKHEIRLVIEQMLPYGTAGIQARAKKVLKQLSK